MVEAKTHLQRPGSEEGGAPLYFPVRQQPERAVWSVRANRACVLPAFQLRAALAVAEFLGRQRCIGVNRKGFMPVSPRPPL
jgi:hypothetical protein